MTVTEKHYLYGISALYRYFDIRQELFSLELIEGSIVDIAKMHDNVAYPGVEGADAVSMQSGVEIIFTCADSVDALPRHPLSVMNLLFDKKRGVFIDKTGCYSDIRDLSLDLSGTPGAGLDWIHLLEAAALVSAFDFKPSADVLEALSGPAQSAGQIPAPSALVQRIYLSAVLTGDFPAAGLKLLMDFGFIEAFWPELRALSGLGHAKEFHPEGDVWEHTLETLYHRKTADLDLSLALLLHDTGKPRASSTDGNRFNNHAQIGTRAASDFMRRLGFSSTKIEKVCYLVKNHMLPAAVKTLPSFRSDPVMSSPHFPLLLEVFRCDLLSTFRGPEAYYEACKVYKTYLKNTKNPFRSSDGKKLLRQYVN